MPTMQALAPEAARRALPREALFALSLPLLVLSASACHGSSSSSGSGGPAGSSFGAPIGIPVSASAIVAAVNPDHRAPYSGPKATLKGMIRIEGDAPPETGLKFLPHCQHFSPAAYGKLFRVGLDRALADALVAVTRYGDRGYVPPASDVVRVDVKDCVPDKLTYAVTYGQRLDFYNVGDRLTYQPYLDGSARGIMIAAPKGSPVGLFPTGPSPAHYMLRDQLGSGLVANVFLLNYATVDVTGLDGHYEIKNIPVGKARLDAMLPVISKAVGQDVDLVEGVNTVDLTLRFDAAKDLPQRPPVANGVDAGSP